MVSRGLCLGLLEIFLRWLLCAQCLSVQDVLLRALLILLVTIPVLFYVFAYGAVWPPSTLLYLLWSCGSMGDCCLVGLWCNFYCGGRSSCGRNSRSFLNSNKFPDADPSPGHGVPAWVGIFSSGGELPAEESSWGGFPWNFSFSKFIMVMEMLSGICMVALLALGWVQVWLLLAPYIFWLGLVSFSFHLFLSFF